MDRLYSVRLRLNENRCIVMTRRCVRFINSCSSAVVSKIRNVRLIQQQWAPFHDQNSTRRVILDTLDLLAPVDVKKLHKHYRVNRQSKRVIPSVV